MAFRIKNPEAERLAPRLAEVTGESLTDAVTKSLKERLGGVGRRRGRCLADELDEIAKRCARVADSRLAARR